MKKGNPFMAILLLLSFPFFGGEKMLKKPAFNPLPLSPFFEAFALPA